MTELTAVRTLVKSAPELWAVCSDADSLAQHLGAFGEIREWLRSNLYVLGRKFTPQETIERVTGSKIDPAPYVRYLREKLAPQVA